jgi:hypothetical protein
MFSLHCAVSYVLVVLYIAGERSRWRSGSFTSVRRSAEPTASQRTHCYTGARRLYVCWKGVWKFVLCFKFWTMYFCCQSWEMSLRVLRPNVLFSGNVSEIIGYKSAVLSVRSYISFNVIWNISWWVPFGSSGLSLPGHNLFHLQILQSRLLGSSWNVMAHGDAWEGKWRGNWRME